MITSVAPKKEWIILKSSDQIVNNSDVYEDDNSFIFVLPKDGYYIIDMYMLVGYNSEAADVKLKWVLDGVSMWNRIVFGKGSSSTESKNAETVQMGGPTSGETVIYGTDDTQASSIQEHLLITGSKGDSIKLQIAQNVATVIDTEFWTGSYMVVKKY
jgi:hypothetical protein